MFCFVFRELFSQHEKSDTLVSGLLDEVGTFYYKSLFSSLLMVHTCTVEFRYIEHWYLEYNGSCRFLFLHG